MNGYMARSLREIAARALICETSGKAVFIPFDLKLEGNLFDNLDDLNKKST